MALTYDMARRSWSPAGLPGGAVGQISLERLVSDLRKTGEIKPDERVTHIEITDNGMIRYRVETT